ncbi:MAG: patatin-like phospholipase family protein [Nitrospirota bacterium]
MEPKICLALGGGAARGLAHLGVLKVLEDAKIPIHMISGTSLGAMMGGLYATYPDAVYWMDRTEEFINNFISGKTRLDFLRKIEQRDLNDRGFFGDMATLIRKSFFWGVTATSSAFIGEEEYRNFMYPLIPDISVDQTKIPFSCVATDIRNGKRIMYTKGSLRTAISASCALPGIFPPVRDNGMVLVDGGWVERVPILCGREMGADIVIGVDVSGAVEKFEVESGLDIILRADAVTRIYLNDILASKADLLIHPAVETTCWADFSNPKEMYKQGEIAASEKLKQIQDIIRRATLQKKTFADQVRSLTDRIIDALIGR